MDYNSDCYLDKSKKYDRFIPETDIKFNVIIKCYNSCAMTVPITRQVILIIVLYGVPKVVSHFFKIPYAIKYNKSIIID